MSEAQRRLAQWQELTQRTLATLTAAGMDAARQAMTQLFASQVQTLHLVEMAQASWQQILASGVDPKDWQAGVAAHTAQLRQQWLDALERWQANNSLQALWQQYWQGWQQLSQPWWNLFQALPSIWAEVASNPLDSQPWQQAMSAGQPHVTDAFAQNWESLLGMPSLGLWREYINQQNELLALLPHYQQAVVDYQRLVGSAWIDAYGAWLDALIGRMVQDEPLHSERELLDLWVELADERFLALFHSKEYAQAQANLINLSMELRQAQRQITERWLRMHDLPTKSDLDEAHRQIYELRKAVKALQKSLKAGSASPKPTRRRGRSSAATD
jgi:class III poly(R)-hydroxyalkanoic acid synthase PhaE subunit